MLAGHHALSKVGQRLEERGLLELLQAGRSRSSLHADRGGPSLDALCATQRTKVLSAIARTALEVSASPTPWRPPDTTTLAL